MKLLFKDNDELKELLGFLDADFSFSNIKADLITATRDVIAVIGKELYEKALGLYEADEEAEDNHLLYLIRYPIAVQSYRLYAPSNDVSHTNNGRKMRMDDHEKQAFEWMIDRDNDALERRYYRAIDDLILYLEEESVEEWKGSEVHEQAKELLVFSTNDFDRVFPINSRLLFLKLVPGLAQCQNHEIRSRMGEKYSEFQAKIIEGSELTTNEAQLFLRIKEAMVFYSLSWAMPRLSVNLFPEGVLQSYRSERSTTNSRKPALKLETQEAAQAFHRDYEKAILEIERLLLGEPEVNEDLPVYPKTVKGNNFISM
jgi:hypothetical protein